MGELVLEFLVLEIVVSLAMEVVVPSMETVIAQLAVFAAKLGGDCSRSESS